MNTESTKVMRGALSSKSIAKERKPHEQGLFDKHMDECRACREEMLDCANEATIISVAAEKNISVEDVLDGLAQSAARFHEIAQARGVSFEQVVKEILRKV